MSTRRPIRYAAVALAGTLALGAAACGRTGGASSSGGGEAPAGRAGETPAASSKADFGSLTGVCQPGPGGGDTATGVKGGEIQVGTFTDFGFTQNREFITTAEAFTQWCNDAGGINGRKLVSKSRDAKLFENRQRILESCREDFFIVGGGAAFDGNGVKDRLKCLLPEIPAQSVSVENQGSDLQVDPIGYNQAINLYQGYFRWLVKEKHPETAQAVGIIAGDIGATKTLAGQFTESFEKSLGAKITYNNVYPPSGPSDWTPYAQAIKSGGVKGLVFLGDSPNLAKLEQALTDINYTLTWIDTSTEGYNAKFQQLAGANLDRHTNYSDPAVYPLENAAQNPATKQLTEIIKKARPDADITKPMVGAWSAWLLFAKAASQCGAELTRKCAYEKATALTTWDGGGLHAPTTPSDPKSKKVCFTVEQASSTGFKPADFKPNTAGAYRCEEEAYELKGDYGKPATLADSGKSLADLK